MPANTSTTAKSRKLPSYEIIARGVSIRKRPGHRVAFHVLVPVGVSSAFGLPGSIRFYCARAGAAERRLALRCREHVLEVERLQNIGAPEAQMTRVVTLLRKELSESGKKLSGKFRVNLPPRGRPIRSKDWCSGPAASRSGWRGVFSRRRGFGLIGVPRMLRIFGFPQYFSLPLDTSGHGTMSAAVEGRKLFDEAVGHLRRGERAKCLHTIRRFLRTVPENRSINGVWMRERILARLAQWESLREDETPGQFYEPTKRELLLLAKLRRAQAVPAPVLMRLFNTNWLIGRAEQRNQTILSMLRHLRSRGLVRMRPGEPAVWEVV